MTQLDKIIFGGCIGALAAFVAVMQRAKQQRIQEYDAEDTWADATTPSN